VTATEVDTGITRSGQSNESGNYTFATLPPGRYAIEIESAGFKKEMRQNIDLIVNTSTRVDVQLQPGSLSESVLVTAAPPLLQTDRSDTGAKIESIDIAALPVTTNRNFQSLLNLVPGTTRAVFQSSQFVNATSSLQTEVNGQAYQSNIYLIEGIDNTTRDMGMEMIIPPIEAIETVDVSTSNFEAELGGGTGAVTNLELKSGGNIFHGAAYEFLQNTDLDARSFFYPTVAPVRYNYFGANIGGPIKKNRIFFFVDYLGIQDHEANANLGTIPSTAFRQGDLSAAPTVVYNPFSGNSDGTGRTPFPNNQVPTSLINPVSTALLGFIPAPNQVFNASAPNNNYYANLPFTKNSNSTDGVVDVHLSDKDVLRARLSFTRPVTFQAPVYGVAGGWAPTTLSTLASNSKTGFEGSGWEQAYSGGLNYDRIFSSQLVAEFRFGVAYFHQVARNSDYGLTDSTSVGIPGVNTSPFTSGMTEILLGGGFSTPTLGYASSLPWDRGETRIDFANTWTRTVGNQTIKWGIVLGRIRDDLLQGWTYGPRGVWDFAEAQTSIPGAKTGFGNDFASFLLDQPSYVGRDIVNSYPASRWWNLAAFVQDKWVVTPKLTVDLGVRWEFYPPPTPHFAGGFSDYNPANNTLVVAGIGGNPMNLGIEKRYKYFAPRLGLAYRLTSSMVLRAGYGMSYTTFCGNNYSYDDPIKQTPEFVPSGTGYGPALLPNGQPSSFQAGFPPATPVVVPSNGIMMGVNSETYFDIPLNLKNPYVESWNLSVQRALPAHFTLDVAYVGNHGVDIYTNPNINAATVIGLGTLGQPEYPRTTTTTLFYGADSTSYNALQVKLNRRYSSGLLITTSYSWGKSMDFELGDSGGLLFYINQHRNYALADYNRTQEFVQSYVYELPFGKGRHWLKSGPAAMILGGWEMNGVLTLQTGLPISLSYSASGLQAPGNTQTPNQIAPVQILHGINNGNPWFSTSSFAAPPSLTFGNVGRNDLIGPGMFDLDFSLFKNIEVRERWKLQLRGEAFAITNTPQFSNPGATLGNGSFGIVGGVYTSGSGVNGVGGGRAVQLGIKLSF
jgi:outer membrane receptor protein involved in Fe transport